jgi:hypothetical protein
MRPELEQGEILLFWQAEARDQVRDLTTFIHLLQGDGTRIAQVDKRPGHGFYATNVWTPGERIIERYQLDLAELCAAGGEVQVVVGWYELAADGARRPRVDAPGDTAVAGLLPLADC